MQVRTLGPKGCGFGGGPTLIGERNECRQGHWTPKRVDCENPTLVERKTKNLYKGVENFSKHTRFKNLEGKPKMTISAIGGLRPLQIPKGRYIEVARKRAFLSLKK